MIFLATIVLLAVVLAATVAGGLALWRREASRPDASVGGVEAVLPSESGEADDTLPPPPGQYEGADDAGAYQKGGAAYAQYSADPYGAAGAAATAPVMSFSEQMAITKEKVVSVADKQLARSGRYNVVAGKLEAGGSKMKPGEWLVTTIALVLGGLLIGLALQNPIVAIIAAGAGAAGSWVWLGRREGKRQKAFSDQLPETLGMLASSLRGGMSMMQSIATIANEADAPTSDEFTRLVTEIRLGRDLGVAFHELADRMQSQDFIWVVNAIDIHREVGGDLAVILDRLANTIRSRNRVLGQMKALSAEGKLSGLILFFLPPAMVALISVLNRDYLNEMVGSGMGIILLIFACFLLLIGGFWMKKLIKFRY